VGDQHVGEEAKALREDGGAAQHAWRSSETSLSLILILNNKK